MRSSLRAAGHTFGIGGVDPVDVGVDLAALGLQRRGQRHRGGVRAAAAERGDVALPRRRPGTRPPPPRRPCASAARSGSSSMCLMRALLNVLSVTIRHWWARKLVACPPCGLDGQREQPDGDLLAGGHHHVLLALARPLVHRLHQLQQPVGLAGHRRDHHHQIVPRRPGLETPPCHGPDAVRIRHRRSPVLLDPQCHARALLHALPAAGAPEPDRWRATCARRSGCPGCAAHLRRRAAGRGTFRRP